MPKITLTQNKYALVDDDDFPMLSKYSWNAHKYGEKYYAETNIRVAPGRKNGSFRNLKMHRLIMNAKPGQIVDHINHDTLNNKKNNLRLCTSAENSRNTNKRAWNKSGCKGVNWHKASNKWIAQIGISSGGKRKNLYLGIFDKAKDAAIAYDIAAKNYHGEFARLNFP